MAYYKVQDRQLIPCPVNCIWRGAPSGGLEEGQSICNYNLLPGPVLEGQGWKSAILDDPLPEYDPDSQQTAPWYEDCGTYIARRWEIVALPQPTPEQMAQALEILGVELKEEEAAQG